MTTSILSVLGTTDFLALAITVAYLILKLTPTNRVSVTHSRR